MSLSAKNKVEECLGIILVVIGVLLRVLPHPWNFTPTAAIALFSGVILSPGIALAVPLTVMISSDLILGASFFIPSDVGCFFLVCLLGLFVRKMPGSVIYFRTVAGSVLFFIVTNLGVFLFQNMYTKDFAGLIACYIMALPVF